MHTHTHPTTHLPPKGIEAGQNSPLELLANSFYPSKKNSREIKVKGISEVTFNRLKWSTSEIELNDLQKSVCEYDGSIDPLESYFIFENEECFLTALSIVLYAFLI